MGPLPGELGVIPPAGAEGRIPPLGLENPPDGRVKPPPLKPPPPPLIPPPLAKAGAAKMSNNPSTANALTTLATANLDLILIFINCLHYYHFDGAGLPPAGKLGPIGI